MSNQTQTSWESKSDIPEKVSGIPIEMISNGERLPCPHEDCSFAYYSKASMGMGGKLTPATQDKHSATDSTCEHFYKHITTENLERVLNEATNNASEIYCVVNGQESLATNVDIAVYIEPQTSLLDY
jgi:hypothetical protein